MYDSTPAPFGGPPLDRPSTTTSADGTPPGCSPAAQVTSSPTSTGPASTPAPATGGWCPRRRPATPVALGSLATTHRPLLVARGRALFLPRCSFP